MVPGGVPFPMLSDAGGRIGSVYGIYDEEAGVDIRGRFIIDPDGVIQAMEVLTPPVGRNVAEFIRQVKAFQHVRSTGEVDPFRMATGKANPQARSGFGGKGVESLETGNGLLNWRPPQACRLEGRLRNAYQTQLSTTTQNKLRCQIKR